MKKLTTALLTGSALLLFTACGGGGGGGSENTTPPPVVETSYNLLNALNYANYSMVLEGTVDNISGQKTNLMANRYVRYMGKSTSSEGVEFYQHEVDTEFYDVNNTVISETLFDTSTYEGNKVHQVNYDTGFTCLANKTHFEDIVPLPTNATIGYTHQFPTLHCDDGSYIESFAKLLQGNGTNAVAQILETRYDINNKSVKDSKIHMTLTEDMELIYYEEDVLAETISGTQHQIMYSTSITQ